MIKAIIGSQFGDCGKGLFTDYISSKFGANAVVVRVNGGAQAGHSVISPDNIYHVFHHIGSGSFNNSATFLSKYFIVNPILFRKEIEELKSKGISPKVYVDPNCIITTPYDMIINQIVESSKGNSRHGSCGCGINETIERNLNFKEFTLQDCIGKSIVDNMLVNIKTNYIFDRLKKLNVNTIDDNWMDIIDSSYLIQRYCEDVEFFYDNVTYCSELQISKMYDNIIFEGAQGLLLDEDHRFFPHVTRSKTGVHNIIELCKNMNIYSVDVHYMTRSYLTRHGNGPLPYELTEKPYKKVEDKTNIFNEWQGNLRFAYLNLDLLKESIQTDIKLNQNKGVKINPSLTVTCMDQVENECIKYYKNDCLHHTRLESEFIHRISEFTGIDVDFVSFGPTRNDIMRLIK